MAAASAGELHVSRVPVYRNQDKKPEVADRVVINAADPRVRIGLSAASGEFTRAKLPPQTVPSPGPQQGPGHVRHFARDQCARR